MINVDDVRWLWSASGKIVDKRGLKAAKMRFNFLASALRRQDIVRTLRRAPAQTSLGRLIASRPAMLGAFLWPYQNAAWGPAERWRRIIDHCAVIDELDPPFQFDVDECLVLLDLAEAAPGCRIVLDQPVWFMREGQLTLNIFVENFRAYSLAFSFFHESDGAVSAHIGAVQGRDRDDILDVYRTLTKQFHGIRPRDFLIDVLRMLCRRINAARMLAVADSCRHHRHPYFNNKEDFTINYDEIWLERGGKKINEAIFELPIDGPRRALGEIKPKKRSMYRKRYAFLDALESQMSRDLPRLSPVRFKDA